MLFEILCPREFSRHLGAYWGHKKDSFEYRHGTQFHHEFVLRRNLAANGDLQVPATLLHCLHKGLEMDPNKRPELCQIEQALMSWDTGIVEESGAEHGTMGTYAVRSRHTPIFKDFMKVNEASKTGFDSLIGIGSFGRMHCLKVAEGKDSIMAAVKVLHEGLSDLKCLEKEVMYLYHIKHPNIVQVRYEKTPFFPSKYFSRHIFRSFMQ